jgi:hypothetical protein
MDMGSAMLTGEDVVRPVESGRIPLTYVEKQLAALQRAGSLSKQTLELPHSDDLT